MPLLKNARLNIDTKNIQVTIIAKTIGLSDCSILSSFTWLARGTSPMR